MKYMILMKYKMTKLLAITVAWLISFGIAADELKSGESVVLAGPEEQHFYIDLPINATRLTVTVENNGGDPDIYVTYDRRPSLDNFDCRSWYPPGEDEECVIEEVQGGRYYILVHDYETSHYQGAVLTATYSVPELTNGQTVRLDGSEDLRFFIDVPNNASQLSLYIVNDFGDPDLYIARDREPTLDDYDCRSWNPPGIDEQCIFTDIENGRYYVLINPYEDNEHAGAELSVYLNEPQLTSGDEVSLAGLADHRFYVDVPSRSGNVSFTIENNGGDPDLYVSYEQGPTLDEYTCRSWQPPGLDEACVFEEARPGRYYIFIDDYEDSAYRNAVLRVNFDIPTIDANSRVTLFGPYDHRYNVQVPRDAINLNFSITTANGDPDLYVSSIGNPTTDIFECRSWNPPLENEECFVQFPSSPVYYLLVDDYEETSYTDALLSITYDSLPDDCSVNSPTTFVPSTASEVPPTCIAADNYSAYGYFWVDDNALNARIITGRGTGNGDLFYRGSDGYPTDDLFDASSTNEGNFEEIVVERPNRGWHHFRMRAQDVFDGATIRVDVQYE